MGLHTCYAEAAYSTTALWLYPYDDIAVYATPPVGVQCLCATALHPFVACGIKEDNRLSDGS
jgi:hypothetical protein